MTVQTKTERITDEDEARRIHEGKWTKEARSDYFQSHPENFAGPDMSFPIKDTDDVRDAARLHGHADDPEAVKRKIISIAKRLGLESALPDDWRESNVAEHQLMLEPRIIEQLSASAAGHEVRVTVISGGRSKNGYYYYDGILQQIANLIEGAHAYADHSRNKADQETRSVRDVVGFYHDAEFIAGSGAEPARVDATLHIFEAAEWLWSLVSEAILLGRPELIGLSIDVFGQWKVNEATKSREVTNVLSLNSCDVVTKPSAGGALRRILHDSNTQGEDMKIKPTDIKPDEESQEPTTTTEAPAPVSSKILEQQHMLESQRIQVEQMLAEARLQRAELTLERRLQESILPAAVKEKIKEQFKGRTFEESELDNELTSALNMMAQLTRDGLVRGNGFEKQVSGVISEAEKIQAAFDRMFDLDVDTKLDGIRGFHSLREAYIRVTGDSHISGLMHHGRVGDIRVSESAPIARISEADTTTASFSYLLGSSMNKRLLKDYQAWPAEWMKFVTIAPIRDFKQQDRVRYGSFGSLPIVAENTPYTAVVAQDSAATYVAQKRGNLVTVSREAIINDDLQAIKQVPTKLAVAAAYTLAEFVYTFLSANPNIYDGSALFTVGAPHTNLGAAALSSSAMQTGVTAMRIQTNFSGKRIGLRPRYLIVPPELEFTAMIITKSAGVPGSGNNDINPMLGYTTPVVSPQLTNASQWYLAADPREVDTIEIGFVGGQINPILMIQDQPLLGMNFSQDLISYKIRHEYGGAIVDFRGLYRGI